MNSFTERHRIVVGLIGIALTVALMAVGMNYKRLPFIQSNAEYSAYFSQAGGLTAGAPVQISGMNAGQVLHVGLDGARVLVTFSVDDNMFLGDRSEAAIKTNSLLGAKLLEITPRGDKTLADPIPLAHTTPPYELADALGDLATTVDQLDTGKLSDSLKTMADAFSNTPPALQAAVQGLGRFSQVLNTRDDELRQLLDHANKATKVLSDRSDQVRTIIESTNSLLGQLQSVSTALDGLSSHLSELARQLSGFIADNRAQLKPALDKLNGVLGILSNRRQRIQQALPMLASYAMSLGEALSSGPFFNATIANLLPGQFVQPFIDAAFSDLGLDPNVLLPSQLTDPQTGQPGTPALPIPFPRTGQGGEPRLNLPDAITGNPGDQPCGPAGAPQSGPGCYPYRQPEPAPPPGGPPPGPPAIVGPPPGPTPVLMEPSQPGPTQ